MLLSILSLEAMQNNNNAETHNPGIALAQQLLTSYECQYSRGNLDDTSYSNDRRTLLAIALKKTKNSAYNPTAYEQTILDINKGHQLHNEAVALIQSMNWLFGNVQTPSSNSPQNPKTSAQPQYATKEEGMSDWCG